MASLTTRGRQPRRTEGAKMKITKHRAEGGGWAIRIGGMATGLTIIKGNKPRYREPQMYDVFEGCDWMFEAKSVHAAILTVQRIVAAIYAVEAGKAGGL